MYRKQKENNTLGDFEKEYTQLQLTTSELIIKEFIKQVPNKSKYNSKTQKEAILHCAYFMNTLSRRIRIKSSYNYIYVPFNHNVYSPNYSLGISEHNHFGKYHPTAVRLAVNALKYFKIILVHKGYFHYSEYENEVTQKKEQIKIDAKVTKIYLNDPSEWRFLRNYLQRIELIFAPEFESNEVKAIVRNKDKGTEYSITNSDFTKDLETIYDFLKKKGYKSLKYTRIFKNNPESYGRCYNWLQFIPKSYRKQLCVSMGLSEIDFSSFNPNLFHILVTGEKFPFDPYEEVCKQAGLPVDKIYRKIIKKLTLSLYGSSSRGECLSAIRQVLNSDYGVYISEGSYLYPVDATKARNENEIDEWKYKYSKELFNKFLNENSFPEDTSHLLINAEYILDIIEDVFKTTKDFFYKESTKLSQYIESETAIQIMKKMVKFNILPLSIHDSFLMPEKYKDYFNDYKELALLLNVKKYLNKNSLINNLHIIDNSINNYNIKLLYIIKSYNNIFSLLLKFNNIMNNYYNIRQFIEKLEHRFYLSHDTA